MYKRKTNQQTRTIRTRARIARFSSLPRLTVHRTHKHIFAQIIDQDGKILASASDLKNQDKKTNLQKASLVGTEIAKKAISNKIGAVVFDRGSYKYHGRVKALAEAARTANLKF